MNPLPHLLNPSPTVPLDSITNEQKLPCAECGKMPESLGGKLEYLDPHGWCIADYFQDPLPPIDSETNEEIRQFLKKEAFLTIDQKRFSLSLEELLNNIICFCDTKNIVIKSIAIIGSVVSFLLENYDDKVCVKKFGSPLQERLPKKRYSDVDVRIYLKKGSKRNLHMLTNFMDQLLAGKGQVLIHKVIDNGYRKRHLTEGGGNLYTTLSFGQEGFILEIMPVVCLKRRSLFLMDARHINILPLLRNSGPAELLCENPLDGSMSLLDGWQSIIDKKRGVIHAHSPDQIDLLGYQKIIILATRGIDCPQPKLFETTIQDLLAIQDKKKLAAKASEQIKHTLKNHFESNMDRFLPILFNCFILLSSYIQGEILDTLASEFPELLKSNSTNPVLNLFCSFCHRNKSNLHSLVQQMQALILIQTAFQESPVSIIDSRLFKDSDKCIQYKFALNEQCYYLYLPLPGADLSFNQINFSGQVLEAFPINAMKAKEPSETLDVRFENLALKLFESQDIRFFKYGYELLSLCCLHKDSYRQTLLRNALKYGLNAKYAFFPVFYQAMEKYPLFTFQPEQRGNLKKFFKDFLKPFFYSDNPMYHQMGFEQWQKFSHELKKEKKELALLWMDTLYKTNEPLSYRIYIENVSSLTYHEQTIHFLKFYHCQSASFDEMLSIFKQLVQSKKQKKLDGAGHAVSYFLERLCLENRLKPAKELYKILLQNDYIDEAEKDKWVIFFIQKELDAKQKFSVIWQQYVQEKFIAQSPCSPCLQNYMVTYLEKDPTIAPYIIFDFLNSSGKTLFAGKINTDLVNVLTQKGIYLACEFYKSNRTFLEAIQKTAFIEKAVDIYLKDFRVKEAIDFLKSITQTEDTLEFFKIRELVRKCFNSDYWETIPKEQKPDKFLYVFKLVSEPNFKFGLALDAESFSSVLIHLLNSSLTIEIHRDSMRFQLFELLLKESPYCTEIMYQAAVLLEKLLRDGKAKIPPTLMAQIGFNQTIFFFSIIQKDQLTLLKDLLEAFNKRNATITILETLEQSLQLITETGMANEIDLFCQIHLFLINCSADKETQLKKLLASYPYWLEKNAIDNYVDSLLLLFSKIKTPELVPAISELALFYLDRIANFPSCKIIAAFIEVMEFMAMHVLVDSPFSCAENFRKLLLHPNILYCLTPDNRSYFATGYTTHYFTALSRRNTAENITCIEDIEPFFHLILKNSNRNFFVLNLFEMHIKALLKDFNTFFFLKKMEYYFLNMFAVPYNDIEDHSNLYAFIVRENINDYIDKSFSVNSFQTRSLAEQILDSKTTPYIYKYKFILILLMMEKELVTEEQITFFSKFLFIEMRYLIEKYSQNERVHDITYLFHLFLLWHPNSEYFINEQLPLLPKLYREKAEHYIEFSKKSEITMMIDRIKQDESIENVLPIYKKMFKITLELCSDQKNITEGFHLLYTILRTITLKGHLLNNHGSQQRKKAVAKAIIMMGNTFIEIDQKYIKEESKNPQCNILLLFGAALKYFYRLGTFKENFFHYLYMLNKILLPAINTHFTEGRASEGTLELVHELFHLRAFKNLAQELSTAKEKIYNDFMEKIRAAAPEAYMKFMDYLNENAQYEIIVAE